MNEQKIMDIFVSELVRSAGGRVVISIDKVKEEYNTTKLHTYIDESLNVIVLEYQE